jgi:site-specific recombinase XerD
MEVLLPTKSPPKEVKIDLLFATSLNSLSRSTLQNVKSTLKRLNCHLAEFDLEFNAESIKHFLETTREQVAPNTFNIIRYSTKKIVKAQSHDIRFSHLADTLFKEVRSIKPDKKIKEQDYLTKDEATRLWRYGRDKGARVKRTCLMIKFLFQSGCRISEALDIKLKDIQFLNHKAHIQVIGKGSKVRTVYADQSLIEKCLTFFGPRDQSKGKQALLFISERGNPIHPTSIQKSIRDLATKLNIGKHVHPHTLRHSCAMQLLHEKKLDIKSVSEYLGHSDVSITINSYLHSMISADDVLD